MPIRSMTGFGAGRAALEEAHVVVELRSVNHRYLDLKLPSASSLAQLSARVEPILREALKRGRVEVAIRIDAATGAELGPRLDRERARRAFEELRALRDELDPSAPISLEWLASVPGLFAERSPWLSATAPEAVQAAVQAAIDDLDAMRLREGARLAEDLLARIAALRAARSEVAARVPEALAEYRARLRARVSKALEASALGVDEGRLEQEVVLYADRADIAEELTRLASHFDQFERILADQDEAVGRKLDFLTQELNREVNTIGSKCADGPLAMRVVEMKTEIERIREQVQNIL